MRADEWSEAHDGTHHKRFAPRLHGMVVPGVDDDAMWAGVLVDNGWEKFGLPEFATRGEAKGWCEHAAAQVMAARADQRTAGGERRDEGS